ncbi:basic proline-rich protein-like [Eumetopias jubatus]|uniref:basic proline-rich protein-like n=1 Tax=Eumetopias jubatus TaxID=34886 RepID=UPI00101617F0|nr:basic proline-rich protein-like [Eumetopias jubatus]XP_027952188.1 basic proline-rich protein-like [Eumetopias jubatus]
MNGTEEPFSADTGPRARRLGSLREADLKGQPRPSTAFPGPARRRRGGGRGRRQAGSKEREGGRSSAFKALLPPPVATLPLGPRVHRLSDPQSRTDSSNPPPADPLAGSSRRAPLQPAVCPDRGCPPLINGPPSSSERAAPRSWQRRARLPGGGGACGKVTFAQSAAAPAARRGCGAGSAARGGWRAGPGERKGGGARRCLGNGKIPLGARQKNIRLHAGSTRGPSEGSLLPPSAAGQPGRGVPLIRAPQPVRLSARAPACVLQPVHPSPCTPVPAPQPACSSRYTPAPAPQSLRPSP